MTTALSRQLSSLSLTRTPLIGRVLEFDRVNVYGLRDGQIVEICSYDFDPYTLDAYWG
jgi:hypothetical protein